GCGHIHGQWVGTGARRAPARPRPAARASLPRAGSWSRRRRAASCRVALLDQLRDVGERGQDQRPRRDAHAGPTLDLHDDIHALEGVAAALEEVVLDAEPGALANGALA